MFRNLFAGFGNAGGDAATRKAGDKDVSSVRIAISNGKDKEPLWITAEAWGNLSERLATVKKGDRVGIQGRLVVETYKDKDGVDRTAVKVVCDDVAYLSPKQGADGNDESDPY